MCASSDQLAVTIHLPGELRQPLPGSLRIQLVPAPKVPVSGYRFATCCPVLDEVAAGMAKLRYPGEIHVIMDKFTGRARGFAFVTMNTKEGLDAAIKGLNGKEWKGRALTVNEARPREERPAGGGEYGGRSHSNR